MSGLFQDGWHDLLWAPQGEIGWNTSPEVLIFFAAYEIHAYGNDLCGNARKPG